MSGPNIFVPEDDFAPPSREPLPSGRYLGDIGEFAVRANDNGWEGINFSLANLTTPDGATVVTNGAGPAFQLAGRRKFQTFTFANEHSAQATAIGQRNLIQLAEALGRDDLYEVVEEGGKQGRRLATETAADLVAGLSGSTGARIAFAVKQKPRMDRATKTPAMGEDGEAIIDDEVTRVWGAA